MPMPWNFAAIYWRCFKTLGRSRPLVSRGMAAPMWGMIPYTEIAGFAKDHGYRSENELDDFVEIVQRLDEEWLKLHPPK